MDTFRCEGISLAGTEHVPQDLWGYTETMAWVIDGATCVTATANAETARRVAPAQ